MEEAGISLYPHNRTFYLLRLGVVGIKAIGLLVGAAKDDEILVAANSRYVRIANLHAFNHFDGFCF